MKYKKLQVSPTGARLLRDAMVSTAPMKAQEAHMAVVVRLQSLMFKLSPGGTKSPWPRTLAEERLSDELRKSVAIVEDDAPKITVEVLDSDFSVFKEGFELFVPNINPVLAPELEKVLKALASAEEVEHADPVDKKTE